MRSTWPSRPASPAVLQPTMTLAGASIEPRDPPAVCAPRMINVLIPTSWAVFCCNGAKITLELVLLPVMKAPSTPMRGEITGKAAPTVWLSPWARRKVIPLWSINKAMPTIEAMPMLEGTALRSVLRAMRPTTPSE